MSLLILEPMLRFLYNDMSAVEHADFLMGIENNPAMMEQFTMLKQGVEALGRLTLNPADETLRSIISYASNPSETIL
jgi:hypothetical protein